MENGTSIVKNLLTVGASATTPCFKVKHVFMLPVLLDYLYENVGIICIICVASFFKLHDHFKSMAWCLLVFQLIAHSGKLHTFESGSCYW